MEVYLIRLCCVKCDDQNIVIIQIYVDDIVFGSTLELLKDEIVTIMKAEFDMFMVGKLTYFLGLQINQKKDVIFLCQSKYTENMVKKFGLDGSKHSRTPISTNYKLSKSYDDKTIN